MNKKKNTSKEENKQKKDKKQKKKRSILDRVVIVFLVLALLAGLSGVSVIGYIVATTDVRDLEKQMYNKEPTSFLADDESEVGELGMESRENISYEQVPQSVIDAFLSIEDSRFYKHNGFDLPRFLSSAISNLKSGSFAQGGSTLTMQAIDNFFMKPQEEKKSFNSIQKVERKLQEIYMSMHIETKLSKPKIMEKYLNEINFGDKARGIERGAQYFFGKSVEELNLSEAAYLAGCINAPNTYNPYNGYDESTKFNYYEAATQRRNETLDLMLYHGYITETEHDIAKSTQLAFTVVGKEASSSDPYADYLYAAKMEAMELTGKDPATTPMIIHTYLNKDAQKAANEASAGEVVSLDTNKNYQIGTTVLDNKTGGVVAIITGRDDYNDPSHKDRANTQERMPGSSIKPILDYALALDKLGYCTSRVYNDKAIKIGDQTIVNSDGKYYGKVSMERAIAQSLNTPAVQTLKAAIERLGNEPIMNYLKGFGFSDEQVEGFNLGYSMGGSISTSPTQMAAAYATLANGGEYKEPHYISKIEFKDGKAKDLIVKPKTNQAMSPQAAYMTSELLYKAVNGKYKGWNLMGRLGYGAYPVYGKTGTSDWAQDGLDKGIPDTAMKDEWMINYTSEYTVATWSGFDQQVADGNNYVTSQLLYENIPGWINKHMLDTVTKNPKRIANPGGISSYGGGMIKTEFLKDAAKNNPMTEENQESTMDKLEELYKKLSAYKASDYTAESYAKLQKALETVKKMIEDDTATDEEIENALKDLQAAADGLVQNVNKNTLIDVINRAAGLDPNIYTSSSYSNLRKAVESAKAVLNKDKLTQQEIDAAIASVNNAINGLVKNPVIDRSGLQSALSNADAKYAAMDDSDPNKASLKAAIDAARNILNNANASQSEIDAQTAALNTILGM